MVLLYALIFLIGLCVGSFLNVLIARLDRKEGILSGRSECPDCHRQLSWRDLFPVLSYIFLKGKCRYCGFRISPIYPAVELTTAFVVWTYFFINGFGGLADVYYIFAVVLLVSLIFFDFRYLILPDKIVFTIGGLAITYNIFFRSGELKNLLLSGFLFALGFAIIYIGSRGRAMGFGDVKLALVIGLILGYPAGFFSVILAIWVAALCGIFMMLLGKATMKTALPFGSFLAASAVIFIIFDKVFKEIYLYGYFY